MRTDTFVHICENLTKQLPCDFAGLAVYDQYGKEIKWQYAAGNRNEKYKRIAVRSGKGVSGNVIRTGKSMIVPSFPDHIRGNPTDYPIMLAEQLVSCIAVPVHFKQSAWGVLLGGHRSECQYSQEQLTIVKKTAVEIEKLLKENLPQDGKSRVISNDE